MTQISLKALRVNAGLTQTDAAKVLGVSRMTLSRWESGETYPRADNILKLAALYKCEPADFLIKEPAT